MFSVFVRTASRELKSTVSLVQKRFFMLRPKTSEKTYKRKDKVDDAFSIIYKAPMENYIIACNILTTASAAVAVAFGVYRFIYLKEELSSERKVYDLAEGEATISDEEYTYFTTGLVLICISLRMILYKYPLRIYRNLGSYIGIFEGHLPMIKQKINFQRGDVRQLPLKGIMPWKEHRYMIKDRSTILYYEYFRSPAELTNMQTAPKK